MSKFCVTTSLAIAFDYILELAIFAPMLALTFHWEGDCKPFQKKMSVFNII